ncbi:MAG: cobalamin B12-binding domain-containing protein [Clostridiales bacterium]|nr:cobalamin B12-binding domain-containing protein [Clostridiales bacterium]
MKKTSSFEPSRPPIRVVVAKPGLDSHDRGAKVLARALRDAGMEVIYTGLHRTPEEVVRTVVEEDAEALCISLLSGAHTALVPRIMDLLREAGMEHVVVFLGGTIPDEDVPAMKAAGVAGVYGPGSDLQVITEDLRRQVERVRERA